MTLMDHDLSVDADVLFGDIMPDVEINDSHVTIPEMPDHLVQYDVACDYKMARQYGAEVFTHWLRGQLTNREMLVPKPLTPRPCHENPDLFFTEYPDNTDEMSDWFGVPDEDVNLLVASAEANIKTAQAKKDCASCEQQVACRVSSVLDFQAYGIWGGYGRGGRERILNNFLKLRREYNQGRMKADEEAEYVAAAMALDSAHFTS